MAPGTDIWADRAFLREVQYRTGENLAARQSIYAYHVRSLSEVQRLSDPAPLVSRVLSALFPNGQDCRPITSHSGILICG